MNETLNFFSATEWPLVVAIFVWTGFVRSGIGFGGAALGLPIMLLLRPDPLFWIPVIGTQLLFFTFITVIRRMSNVDWAYLKYSLRIMIIPKLLGVLGLVFLPPVVLVVIVYCIILAFAIGNIFNYQLRGNSKWAERFFLIMGGYVSGTSLVGAPLIVAAYSQHVEISRLRDTLFVLWFILVVIKLSSLAILEVPLQGWLSLILLPAAGIGHVAGLRVHAWLLSGNDVQFRRYLGIGLAFISVVGLVQVVLNR